MADAADWGSDLAEAERAASERQARSVRHRFPPVGICYYCGEPIENGGAFCDEGCRDDFELQQKLKRQNGGRLGADCTSPLALAEALAQNKGLL